MLRKASIILIILTISLSFMAAPLSARSSKKSNSFFESGLYSFQIGVRNDFEIQSYNGNMISLKRFSSDRSAWGVSFLFSFNDNDLDDKQIDFFNDSSVVSREVNSARADHRMDINLKYFYYVSNTNDVKGYFGVGPSFSFSNYKNKMEYDDNRVNSSTRDRYGYGIGSLVGVEWFVKDRISFMAEYNIDYEYFTEETKTKTRNRDGNVVRTSEREFSGYRFRTSSATFGISFYF